MNFLDLNELPGKKCFVELKCFKELFLMEKFTNHLAYRSFTYYYLEIEFGMVHGYEIAIIFTNTSFLDGHLVGKDFCAKWLPYKPSNAMIHFISDMYKCYCERAGLEFNNSNIIHNIIMIMPSKMKCPIGHKK
jgi:hypothetical protein